MPNRRKIDELTIAELLLQPYEVDPGSIETLIEEASQGGPDGVVRVVCAALGASELSPTQRLNLREFISRALLSPSNERALLRSLKRKGRCPAGERRWLRTCIEPEVISPPKVVSGVLSTDNALLDLRSVSGALGEFHQIVDRIGAMPTQLSNLRVALGEFTYASAVAVVAQWILARRLVNRYEFVDTAPGMEAYLENISFAAALRNPEIKISQDPMDWAVGLTRINRDQPTEKVTEKVVDILHTFVNPGEADRQALLVLISEMIENVHRHAKSPVDGFAVAQVYPRQLKMGITLVDAGIGVRQSFVEGQPSVATSHLRSDEAFLREAVKLYSTSKRDRHTGYGLYLLAELVGRNRGTFLLTSGTASLVGYRRGHELVFDSYTHRPWQGTIVSVILDLNRDLPLTEIYKEMPAPKGFEDDDLFL